MEWLRWGLWEELKSFIGYISERFSSNFTQEDFKKIWNKIWQNKIEKYLIETKLELEKKRSFDFMKFYNKLLPNKRKSNRFVPKMKNLLWYMVNFCRKQNQEIISEKVNTIEDTWKKEIIALLNSNDFAVKYLVDNFCKVNWLKSFKYHFAKEYKNTEGENNLDKLMISINSLCRNTVNLEPEDKIIIKNSSKITIKKASEEIIKKYNEFAINENEEDYKIINGSIDTSNTVQEILINFFKDHKLDKFGIKNEKIKDDTKEWLNNLFDN